MASNSDLFLWFGGWLCGFASLPSPDGGLGLVPRCLGSSPHGHSRCSVWTSSHPSSVWEVRICMVVGFQENQTEAIGLWRGSSQPRTAPALRSVKQVARPAQSRGEGSSPGLWPGGRVPGDRRQVVHSWLHSLCFVLEGGFHRLEYKSKCINILKFLLYFVKFPLQQGVVNFQWCVRMGKCSLSTVLPALCLLCF